MSGAAVLAALFIAYGLFASRLERSLITAPIFFVATGLVLGPSAADILSSGLDSETALVITELTLGVLLFADAATVRLREVEGDARLPVRLLLVGCRSRSRWERSRRMCSSPKPDGHQRRSSHRSWHPPMLRSAWRS